MNRKYIQTGILGYTKYMSTERYYINFLDRSHMPSFIVAETKESFVPYTCWNRYRGNKFQLHVFLNFSKIRNKIYRVVVEQIFSKLFSKIHIL